MHVGGRNKIETITTVCLVIGVHLQQIGTKILGYDG